MTTGAPGTKAPCESVTRPRMVPRAPCANSNADPNTRRQSSKATWWRDIGTSWQRFPFWTSRYDIHLRQYMALPVGTPDKALLSRDKRGSVYSEIRAENQATDDCLTVVLGNSIYECCRV